MELEVQMGISIPVFGVLSGALTGGPDGAGGGIGGNLGGFNGSYPFNTITNAIYNFTGGLTNPTTPITNIINNFTGCKEHYPHVKISPCYMPETLCGRYCTCMCNLTYPPFLLVPYNIVHSWGKVTLLYTRNT